MVYVSEQLGLFGDLVLLVYIYEHGTYPVQTQQPFSQDFLWTVWTSYVGEHVAHSYVSLTPSGMHRGKKKKERCISHIKIFLQIKKEFPYSETDIWCCYFQKNPIYLLFFLKLLLFLSVLSGGLI